MARMNPEDWKNIDPADPDAVGKAYTRFTYLLRHDPYVSFFNDEVRTRIAELVFSPECLATESRANSTLKPLEVPRPAHYVKWQVVEVMEKTPLGLLLSPRFAEHLGDLARLSVLPQGEEG